MKCVIARLIYHYCSDQLHGKIPLFQKHHYHSLKGIHNYVSCTRNGMLGRVAPKKRLETLILLPLCSIN